LKQSASNTIAVGATQNVADICALQDWQFRTDVSVHRQASKMGTTGCPKISVPNYQSALCKLPEELKSWCASSESNKLQKIKTERWADKDLLQLPMFRLLHTQQAN